MTSREQVIAASQHFSIIALPVVSALVAAIALTAGIIGNLY